MIPIEDESQAVHYVVLGFGVVSVPAPAGDPAVLATREHSLGIAFSDYPGPNLTIGYSAGSVVAVPENADDVRVEISPNPGGTLVIEAPATDLLDLKDQP